MAPAGQAGGEEHLAMTAEPPQSPVAEAVRSLEVRWIFPGQLETAVAGWFGRFPAAVESREDTYPLWLPARQSNNPKHSLTWRARQDSNPRPAA
jgi:hypothetical protein